MLLARFRTITAIICILFPAAVLAELRQSATQDGITWNTELANQGATVTVLGPTPFAWTHQYKAGTHFFLSFDQIGDGKRPNGRFTYEFVLHAPGTSSPMIAGGDFMVLGGQAVNGGQLETSTKDNVVADDSIVVGSQCVGLDCNNGEAFGFDALRLKENNLRVHFDDTSNSSSFPSRDWRLIANDTNNGGAEYFAIEDATAARQVFRIGAGAPASSLTVTGNGNVGLGTLTAQEDVHVVRGDSPTLRLDQNAANGFTPQVWDVGGNETQFYVRNSSAAGAIPFRVLPNAISGLLTVGDAVSPSRVTVDGEFFIGTDQVTPDYVFEPGFEVMSIEEHTEAMYSNSHLPYVEAAQVNQQGRTVINVSARSQGVLKELEIAHIYISELHERIEQLEQRLQQLED